MPASILTEIPPLLSIPSDVPPAVPKVSNSAGMLFACWAIVIVMALMSFVFLRAGKKEYALANLPLAMVPFVHIFSRLLADWADPFIPLTAPEIRVAIDLTVALISCLLIGITSRAIPERRTRNGFSLACTGFTVILTLVLVVNILKDARL